MHFRGWLYATHQTLRALRLCATVNVQGLWIALLRPDIEHKPSEWGRVVVVRPCATNRGRLLADAKLDGVIDYPNCRSRGEGLLARWYPLWGLLSPSDTNSIPHFAPKVKGFWAEILHKVLAIFDAEIVQLDEERINRRAAALGATAKRKGRLFALFLYYL